VFALNPAVLVHRGRGLSAEEQAALDWARHGKPLSVLALDLVVSFFLSAPTAPIRNDALAGQADPST
jgi:hypothetical protein